MIKAYPFKDIISPLLFGVDIPRKVYQYFRFETLPGFPAQRLPATAGLL